MTDKYVSDMNPTELRAHMRRLKAMNGWHEPLADALFAEIQRMDALLAAPSASAQQAEPVALKLPEGFVDAVWLSICELPGRTSPEDDPEACICDYDEFKGCFESAQESFAAPAPNASPAAEQRDECGMTESDWKRAEALADMLRLPDERTNALQSALQDSRYGDEPKQVESPHEQRERVQFEQAFPRLEKERDSRGHYDRHLTRLAWQGWLARAILAASPADQAEDAPDMFWDADNPERCQDSVHNVVVEAYENGCNVGEIVEVQQAIRLHNIKVRIIADPDDGEEISYEPVEGAAMSASKEPK